jgi:hypothetical protein
MVSAHGYRRLAADCLKLSSAVADPEARALLERMAIVWANLADQAERNLLSDACELPQSVVQQRQQPRRPKGLDFDGLTPEEQRRIFDD